MSSALYQLSLSLYKPAVLVTFDDLEVSGEVTRLFLRVQIPVPSIIPSSSRWSWDPEEERKRQEKWQKEQERLLQVHGGALAERRP